MAGTRPIGANLAASVASASWWAHAHHPRLSLVSAPPGVDAGPEPVPGLGPGARHDEMATAVPPVHLYQPTYVSAHGDAHGHDGGATGAAPGISPSPHY